MDLPANEIIWTKCYEDGWKDHIVPEAFSHPAKMAYGLLKRILSHCKDEGWGGVNIDPFGGIGSTGILGAYEGYQVICVELEAKFVNLAKQNFELHRKAWEQFGNPYPVIIQGDSRRLCELVESADIIVSSPPFCEAQTGGGIAAAMQGNSDYKISDNLKGSNQGYQNQGHTPGQLGSMKAGKVDMEIGLIISSPPYEGSIQTNGDGIDWTKIKEGGTNKTLARAAVGTGYGKTNGQLAEEQGDTFWQAAKEILEQCHKILKPGGHAIWVCKDFVRKGQRVPFSDDWQRLCESAGFKTLHRHKAMLVKETKYESLFGHEIVKKTERKSFFRRLAEAKGSPKIDWEDVICMIRR